MSGQNNILLSYGEAAAGNGLLTNLVSYYKLDEASGTIIDAHGSNDSVFASATYGATGIIGDALEFNGSSNYISMGDVLGFDYNEAHSFSTWIKRDVDGVLRMFLTKYDTSGRRGYMCYLGSDNYIYYSLRNNDSTNFLSVRSNTTITASMGITHVTITYDGSSSASGVSVYVDGSSVATTTVTDTLSATSITTAPFNLSGRNNGSNLWDGIIDEVGIWSRELSATDVTTLYNSGSGLAYSNFTS